MSGGDMLLAIVCAGGAVYVGAVVALAIRDLAGIGPNGAQRRD